jgi:hypothetical protein
VQFRFTAFLSLFSVANICHHRWTPAAARFRNHRAQHAAALPPMQLVARASPGFEFDFPRFETF